MRFYNRQSELKNLQRWTDTAHHEYSQLTMMVGRRRVGKTTLLKQAFEGKNVVYLFVSRKAEPLLAEEFTEQIKAQLDLPIYGQPDSLKAILEILLTYAKSNPITVIMDEFQDIQKVNASFFSDMQNLWDNHRLDSRMHLVCCGSLYSMMTHLFQNSKQPLFGRADHRINLKPLKPTFIKAMMSDHGCFSPEALLEWYCFSGGIPKYLEWLVQCDPKQSLWPQLIDEFSLTLEEGKYRLTEEFGREQSNYFSILSAIASGKTSRSDIESMLQYSVGPQLKKLEEEFDIIERIVPILSKPGGRMVKYQIKDAFLNFWFRYIHKNQSSVEVGNLIYVQQVIERDFEQYSGAWLERLFKSILAESGEYNQIGTYWEKGNQNEIDIVAVNDANKQVVFIEVKRNIKHYSKTQLIAKSQKLLSKFKGYEVSYRGMSLEDLVSLN
ncbi:ATP-binding protein [Vibrio diabolicus]|uniref:ATP-binding protein n=1 Tax=Vibrio diabolicus TaxID=50719 RepID=UPI0021519A05|nr:ATP-binding protein [Vibrio diabolicus]MCE3221506.1 ATP-binding protein [Vibrio diabolicus]